MGKAATFPCKGALSMELYDPKEASDRKGQYYGFDETTVVHVGVNSCMTITYCFKEGLWGAHFGLFKPGINAGEIDPAFVQSTLNDLEAGMPPAPKAVLLVGPTGYWRNRQFYDAWVQMQSYARRKMGPHWNMADYICDIVRYTEETVNIHVFSYLNSVRISEKRDAMEGKSYLWTFGH